MGSAANQKIITAALWLTDCFRCSAFFFVSVLLSSLQRPSIGVMQDEIQLDCIFRIIISHSPTLRVAHFED